MIQTDASLVQELDDLRPRVPVGLLSSQEKDRLIERSFLGLYRWYSAKSQQTRNWNPDLDINWRDIRTDHKPEINTILEGFFAVEQYVPDYVENIVHMLRRSHGRSHFQIRWGSEEAKHADLWHNSILFSKFRTPEWLTNYMGELRQNAWKLPWEGDPIRMILYTVFQERATQLNYLNLGVIAKGKSEHELYKDSADPVLVEAARVIAIDEAAHYNFFLEGARLWLYYYPTRTLEAMHDVLKYFAMPAGDIIPGYDKFAEVVYKAGIYGPRQVSKDVIQVALDNLGVASKKALEQGIKKTRLVPDEDGNLRETAIFPGLDFVHIEDCVKRIFGKVTQFEEKTGHNEVDPLIWKPAY
ncbi:MAG: acyl-ACP desaturase [Fimbriimonadaceae bacterium]|jgi:acyl-[acyl-carrier-protein] desaturase|nr:acyl-ACP desaturase [Fimbriimonadaceae bacterium]